MTTTCTLGDIVRRFSASLKDLYPESEIRNFCYMASSHLLNYSKIDFYVNTGSPISVKCEEKFNQILERLGKWEPIQYVLGYTEFYGLKLMTDRRTLIPRPETEELVNWIVQDEKTYAPAVLDIGTGTGCIAIPLALNLDAPEVSACDSSTGALELAALNAQLNKAQVKFFSYDLLGVPAALPGRYHIMVSNPPYVRESEKALMRPNVLDYEPAEALFVPDKDPLLFYRNIALLGRRYLRDGGSLYLEINENMPERVVALLKASGYFNIEVRSDAWGKARMVRGWK
jgi:release factor glutamine methyltransferase